MIYSKCPGKSKGKVFMNRLQGPSKKSSSETQRKEKKDLYSLYFVYILLTKGILQWAEMEKMAGICYHHHAQAWAEADWLWRARRFSENTTMNLKIWWVEMSANHTLWKADLKDKPPEPFEELVKEGI